MIPASGNLTPDELREAVTSGEIDTVIVAFTDMQGRLVGKRVSARLFLEDVMDHGAECCNYLLAVDVELNTVDGYAITSWESGYGDMAMLPDLSTLRRMPWLPGTALVIADLRLAGDHSPISVSPREILKTQVDRLAAHDLVPHVATELEFLVFDDDYRSAWKSKYQDLTPASDYNTDYSLHASTRLEPLLRDIRNSMDAAGMYCEGVKGECNLGQQEIAFRYAHAIATCDNHSIYKSGSKEIADAHGKSITFMAKFNEREGNSCHVHSSLRTTAGDPVFADADAPDGMSKMFRHYIAGQLAAMREFTLLYAPNINSYKRFVEGSFAPTAVAWGHDNRSCALRVVGHGQAMRVENRVPGGDVNQYLAVAGMLASGLYGIEHELELCDPIVGNAYISDVERVPTTLREAADLFEQSALAREVFGDDVVAHYVHAARVEVAAYDAAVTDWERIRGFERL
ncbi:MULTISPECIES: glutamine synthetase family protein [unclassified Leucobacter]|uniref:glutamine synthetase family protein n=1 Tax=unclassified Leucobacter TaxID=2621730 RepID=UPI00165D8C2B|nr:MULTISPECIES: glutamine synthetase family protein [unclassified Leucobacter]MBC9927087.1 glutamine synthetase [Leucobacter sp. cx-169]MBC9936368.1 glutamine synthetase [Leucobacter sp. cx-87]